MINNSQIDLKVCGITSSKSIKIAAQKNIKTLGFASNNLLGPNTCDDEMLKELIAVVAMANATNRLVESYQVKVDNFLK